MPFALAVAVVLALAALAVVVVRQRELGAVRRELAAATDRAAAAEQAREDLERSARELGAASEERGTALAASRAREATLAAALEEHRGRAASLEAAHADASTAAAERGAALEAAVAALAGAERDLDRLRRERPPLALDGATAAACWELLVARVERQWAAGVAAHPDERGLADGPGAQLAQAVARELERLREEVGVHAEGAVDGHVDADPLVALLVVGEALAVLAPSAERVRVALDHGALRVTAEDWSGSPDALERLGEVVARTGLLRGVEVEAGGVEVVLGPAGPAPDEG